MVVALKNEVILRIEAKIADGQEEEYYQYKAVGTMHEKGGVTYVQYEEELTEGGKVTNLIKISPKAQELVVHRKGFVTMRQQFLPGKTTSGTYITPYGRLPYEIKTNRWHFIWDKGEEKGKLVIHYEMTLAASEMRTHEFSITIRKRGKSDELH